ncbi:1-acyl-sn-glycerol-3-phosphate acyltransferase alpha-like [Diprion similis]|uniref:1-acyl-sn-glycerol-3-phosphate acyltransferase alpha-like n=1 Tax=Diprion similis TaxID=362088 RepID=UPI001EF957F3|nr:1-acyl-sn-glycerol-3-phosphate acyltransferase alpha-like [Diprion similis]XP_046739023.1 1-acyl-sn-glycerol-3-phosphate acyltransferase alpha-like [Diprion similis]XP_046739024.1 1-acyl-sn-glycerol-3-phosphate acyltransferase alpha-like [Diprion similis]
MTTWLLYFFAIIFVLVVLIVTSDSHDVVRFHARFLLYYIVSSTISVMGIPYLMLRPKDVRNCRDLSLLLKQVTKILGIQWELRGADELSVERGCVVVANHQSTLDILGMFNIWQVMGKCAPVAKQAIFYVWPFGLAAWLGGVVFIDKRTPGKAVATLNETSKVVNTRKVKMWIFPEGTRNNNIIAKGMLPFKKGAFRIAIENQVPILPLVYSPYYFVNHRNHYFGKGKMIIQTLKPIPTEGLGLEDVDDLMKRTQNIMLQVLKALTKEVLAPLPPDYPGLQGIEIPKTEMS